MVPGGNEEQTCRMTLSMFEFIRRLQQRAMAVIPTWLLGRLASCSSSVGGLVRDCLKIQRVTSKVISREGRPAPQGEV